MPEIRCDAALRAARARIGAGDARLLLQHVLAVSAVWLMAHDDAALSDEQLTRFDDLVVRREGGEPIAYLTGEREFFGRSFAVSPAVLIPRHETELLVEQALRLMQEVRQPRLADLGTGSGCIAISLALERPDAAVVAVEASTVALDVARGNAERLGARLEFRLGSWCDPLDGEFDAIVSNPPYVVEGDPHLAQGDVRFEPRSALTAGIDGLADIRRIAADAWPRLRSGAWLLLEHGYDQAAAVAEILEQRGFREIQHGTDLAGVLRTTLGRR
ncbi:MAG TPA: peptide chain release factor N(5)-glutamine methyltransferase [Rhodocyclaceae bacterium]